MTAIARPRPATEATPVLVFIPVVPPSSLSTNARRRGNWREQSRDTADVLADCLMILKVVAIEPIPGPVSLDILVCWPPGRRRPDVDALGSLTKHHIDALVQVGVLPAGDGPDAVVRVAYRQTKVKGSDAAGVAFVITKEKQP